MEHSDIWKPTMYVLEPQYRSNEKRRRAFGKRFGLSVPAIFGQCMFATKVGVDVRARMALLRDHDYFQMCFSSVKRQISPY